MRGCCRRTDNLHCEGWCKSLLTSICPGHPGNLHHHHLKDNEKLKLVKSLKHKKKYPVKLLSWNSIIIFFNKRFMDLRYVFYMLII